ncbi:MAG: hypothetical protein LBH30_03300, partial [Prevotellaceae bacterium]|nr:hypothetical protein [Prevotellaceae bacterium]
CLRPFRANFAFCSFHRALPCAIAARVSPLTFRFCTSLRGGTPKQSRHLLLIFWIASPLRGSQ